MNYNGEISKVKIGETGFHVRMKFQENINTKILAGKAEEHGIRVIPLSENGLMLTSANVPIEEYENAIFLMKKSFI